MKRALVGVIVAACGHAARTAPPPIANVAPPVDAAVAEPDASDEQCTASGAGSMRVAGADTAFELRDCVIGEERHGEDGELVVQTHRVDLVLDHEAARATVADYESGWEDVASIALVGVLHGAKRDDVVLVELASSGEGDGLDAQRTILRAWAVRGDAWVMVGERQASAIDVRFSADGAIATLATCDPAAGATGTGGGACDDSPAYRDGDGAAVQWRWDGDSIDELTP